jgi:hypothetical protein
LLLRGGRGAAVAGGGLRGGQHAATPRPSGSGALVQDAGSVRREFMETKIGNRVGRRKRPWATIARERRP